MRGECWRFMRRELTNTMLTEESSSAFRVQMMQQKVRATIESDK